MREYRLRHFWLPAMALALAITSFLLLSWLWKPGSIKLKEYGTG
jgi:hypothetical protein